MSSYHITTFGCQMNKSDSERIKGLLNGIGMQEQSDHHRADVVVYNTCSVRQTAEDRVYGIVKQLKALKRENPKLIAVVTGCMAGRDTDGKIRARLSDVDLFFPIDEMIYLPKKLSELNQELFDPQIIELSEYEHYLKIKPSYASHVQSYIAISNGCNKFCTYCVVPYSRGRQKDRPLQDILIEVQNLADHGCLEITLLGQTVNLYNPPDKEHFSKNNPFDHSKNGFASLMWELNQITGIQRIHFTAPHPQYMDDSTLDALCLPKLLNYLHLPVQSGSNEILKRMNRPYTREYYIETIQKLRSRKPDIALGTDIIVGFSGESEDDFAQTVDLYRTCDFDISYTAQYSVRSGTAAIRMYKDDVSKVEKKKRWHTMQHLMEETVLRKNQAYVGKNVEVLVDACEKGLCSGNSREMKRVLFRGNDSMIGTLQSVIVDRALEWVLYGTQIKN